MRTLPKFLMAAMITAALPLVPVLARAETPRLRTRSSAKADPFFRGRAQNLARQAAIKVNGGLSEYRPEPALFGPAADSAFVTNPDGSITFKVKGGDVGYTTPTQETVVRVTPSNQISVLYNGPIRIGLGIPQPTVPAVPSQSANVQRDEFLIQAQNLARQAAIEANGGLDEYRPEASMFGPVDDAPYVKNANGSVTFTFKGGSPGASTLTQETIVTVMPTDQVMVNYNDPIRSVRSAQLTEPISSTGLGGDTFLVQAQNLARQAAIKANGGLDEYRPEATMFGPVEDAPYLMNPDGSVTFRFEGGPPNGAPTMETAVTVTRSDAVMVDYNRQIQ